MGKTKRSKLARLQALQNRRECAIAAGKDQDIPVERIWENRAMRFA
jgi:hypothetical protein